MLWIFLVLLFKANFVMEVQSEKGFTNRFEELRKECFRNQNNRSNAVQYSEKITCRVDFFGSCWPETVANQTVSRPCPPIFFDDLSGNITRKCNESGEWGKPDISFCNKRSMHVASDEEEKQLLIFVGLNWCALSIMIPSLIVIVCLLKCRNERFNVHTNLILAFTFRITTFFVHHYGDLAASDRSRVSCNIFWVLNRYFAAAEIMWMLNEALLLLRKVVVIFDKKSYFKHYLLIGWGSPVAFMAAYIPTIVFKVDRSPKRCWMYYKDSMYMLVLYVPQVIVLVIDVIALIYTVSVFVRRQKSQQKNDFVKLRKAIKGTLILSPLLGVIYLLIFFVPVNAPVWYHYFLHIAYPMQGTLACLVYITFSGEMINRARSKYQSSLRGTRTMENGYSWGTRSRILDRSMRCKTVPPSPNPSIDPSGLSHSSPPCDDGSRCGCPDAQNRIRLTSGDEDEDFV